MFHFVEYIGRASWIFLLASDHPMNNNLEARARRDPTKVLFLIRSAGQGSRGVWQTPTARRAPGAAEFRVTVPTELELG